MSLSTQDQILIEQRVTNDAKSPAIAYLLWFFLGGFGGHRFYLGRAGTGLLMIVLLIGGAVLSAVGIGFIMLGILGIWVLVDAFLIPGMVTQNKNEIRSRLSTEMGRSSGSLAQTG